MAITINVTGEVVTAFLSGELDHHTAKDMREQIDNAVELNMPSMLVLDFKDIGFCTLIAKSTAEHIFLCGRCDRLFLQKKTA